MGLAGATALLAVWGSLEAITAFASLAFILVFGGTAAIAVRRRHEPGVHPVPPVVGAFGALTFLLLMAVHHYTSEPGTFFAVIGLAVLVVVVELLYFEREALEGGSEDFESAVNPGD